MKKHILTRPHVIVLITSIIALGYFSLNIWSWKFLTVGDDWAAYHFAKYIAEKNFLVSPFDMQGVYNENPVLGSIYQAVFLKIFNYSHLAWRFSNIILIIPISFLFYLWIKESFDKPTALIGTILLQSSFYLANFFKIGYINPQAFALFILCLFLANRFSNTQKAIYALFLGGALGYAFYIYIGPLFPLIIWPYLLPFILGKYSLAQKIKGLFLILIPYLLLIVPGILDFSNFAFVSTRTILKKEYTDNFQIVINLLHSFSLYYKNYDYFYNHFVSGPYVDVLTRIFTFIGTIMTLFHLKEKKYFLFFLTYVVTVNVITITAPYAYSPVTRGIFYLPFAFIFAAIALSAIHNRSPRMSSHLFLGGLLASIFLINLSFSQTGVFRQTGYTQSALLLKSIQDASDQTTQVLYVQTPISFRGDLSSSIRFFQEQYALDHIVFSHKEVSSITCDDISQSYIVVLHKEKNDILQHIRSLPCKHSPSLTTISPTMNL